VASTDVGYYAAKVIFSRLSTTLAASVLLVGFNWPEKSERYRRMANFVEAFFSKFDEFHKPPRHPKWSEAEQRFKAADDWLAEHAHATAPAA
jgi:hypothetical protein